MFLAERGVPDLWLVFWTMLGGAMSAGSASAFNCYIDRDIDRVMKRTQKRPLVTGELSDREALVFAWASGIISIAWLGFTTNWVAAALSLVAILFYVFVYTIWLKRTSVQNIVIGGAAGAVPVLVGWAAVTNELAVAPFAMFAIIFVWTPPHFWALALFMKSDYHEAKVPMLTVTHGRPATRRHIFAYTLVLAGFALWLGVTSIGGPLYMAVAVVLNAAFILGGWQVLRRSEDAAQADDYAVEKRVFRLSLYYLFLHFLALLVQSWMGGW